MVSSIINSGILLNMSYGEVVVLLGPPSFYVGLDHEVPSDSGFAMDYLTGASHWIDLERLRVKVMNDTVMSVEVYYD